MKALRAFSALLLAGSLVVLPALLAHAQTATVASGTTTIVPVGSTLNDVLVAYSAVVFTIVSALVGWAATWFSKKTGIQVKQSTIDSISQAANKEANVILGSITNMSAFNIDVGNPTIAKAANTLLPDLEPALTSIGITPVNMQAYIAKEIAAHLGASTATMPDAAPLQGNAVAAAIAVPMSPPASGTTAVAS